MRLTDDGVSLVGAQTVRASDVAGDLGVQEGLVERVASMTVIEVRDAVVAGEMAARDAAAAEAEGRQRASILSMG